MEKMHAKEMSRPSVNLWGTYAEATLDIARQIGRKFGDCPDVVGDIVFQSLPCRDECETFECLAAYPRKEGAAGGNLMLALYRPRPIDVGGNA